MTAEPPKKLSWLFVDPDDECTWPALNRLVLVVRRDGFHAFMKRSFRSPAFMWYTRYPRNSMLPVSNIERFAYISDEMLSPRSGGFVE